MACSHHREPTQPGSCRPDSECGGCSSLPYQKGLWKGLQCTRAPELGYRIYNPFGPFPGTDSTQRLLDCVWMVKVHLAPGSLSYLGRLDGHRSSRLERLLGSHRDTVLSPRLPPPVWVRMFTSFSVASGH